MNKQECEIPKFNPTSEEIKKILTQSKNIAIVGLSSNPEKASYKVAQYLKNNGYKIFPVNPNALENILNEKVYKNLSEIKEKIDLVNIFRLPKDIPPIIEEAIKIKAKIVWMQEGIVNNQAAEKAKNNNLQVVMNKCIMKEHKKLQF